VAGLPQPLAQARIELMGELEQPQVGLWSVPEVIDTTTSEVG
jgi:hypothetical protein